MSLIIKGLLAGIATIAALVLFTAYAAWRAGRLVPPCGRFVTVDGVKLHVLEVGRGPTIVMLHGLSSQLQTFTYALADLLAPRYRLVMVDRPGCGYSAAAPDATLATQATIVANLLRVLELPPALIVGHSLGGALALALAAEQADVVAGLALLAPASLPQDDVPLALRALAMRSDLARWIVGWTIAVPLGLWRRRETMHMLFEPDRVPDDFASRAGAALAVRPWTFRNGCRDLVEAGEDLARSAAGYSKIAVPVGVLFGSGDRILDPVRHGEGLRGRVPDLYYEMISGGHMTPISDPVRSARFIEAMALRAKLPRRASAA